MTATTKPKVRWFVWAGDVRMPRTSFMQGTWGYDVECSCGWGSHTGGGTRRSVLRALWDHMAVVHDELRKSGL